MDLAQATGAVETIDLGGEPYKVRLLTMKEWGAITAWLKRENPSPVTRAMIAIQQAKDEGMAIDAATQDEILDHAQRNALSWPPRLGSTAWFDVLDRVDGGHSRLLLEVLSKADPAFTLGHGEALAPRMSTDEWNDLVRVALYGTPPAPKSETSPVTGATPTPAT